MDRTSDIGAVERTSAAAAHDGLVGRALRRVRHAEGSISYATKLLVGVCAVVLLTGLVIAWLAHRGARASTEAMTGSLFRGVSGHVVAHTREFLLDAEPVLESLRNVPDSDLAIDDPDRLARQLLVVLEGHPGFSWVSYGDEQGTYTGAFRTGDGEVRVTKRRVEGARSPRTDYRVMPDGAWQVVRQEDDSGYDPRRRPFYTAAKARDALVWIPPYVLFDSGLPGVACAAPVRDASGGLRGVLTIEFDLNALSDFVARQSISEHSRVFLFTADQVLLAHPDQPRITASGRRGAGRLLALADVGDPLVDGFRAHLRPEHVAAPVGNAPTFHLFDVRQNETDHIASASGFRLGDEQTWLVGAVAPRSDFLADVWRSQRIALAASLAALLVALLLAAVLARRVVGPVKALIGFMGRVGQGDLEARSDLGGSREFRQLADALNGMIADLRDRLRLRHSLAVAMEVQQRLLPRRPPTVRGLDLAGHSTYCDETGGDYYDFLVVEEATPNSVMVCLGDVTGHGVAAALVMAGARAVLRDRATAAGSLADVMDRLNRMLAADLSNGRFMTMHLAVVDTTSCAYRWVSAGHDPAFIYDPAADSFVEQDEGGLPLGVAEDMPYEEFAYRPLRCDQVIVIGTDGVWEMPNAAGEQFGKPRLREVIRRSAAGTAAEIVEAIVASLRDFRGAASPKDDVTLIVMKMQPVPAAGVATTAPGEPVSAAT